MPISNDVITNRLDKKINYGLARTDFNQYKSVVGEVIPSPIPNPSHDLWMESHLIPDGITGWNNTSSPGTPMDPPEFNTEQIEVYRYNSSANQGTGVGEVVGVFELTLDPSVTSNRSWLVASTPGDPFSPLITNFIRSTYGVKYLPQFVVGPSGASGNTNLPGSTYKTINPVKAGQEFYFDMEAGTLTFAGDSLPTNVGTSGYSVYIKKAYRYSGRIGLAQADWNSYIDYSQLTIPTVDTAEVNDPSSNYSMTSVHEFQFDVDSGFELTDVSTVGRNITKVAMPTTVSSSITLSEQSSDPTASPTARKIFSKPVGGGGTGVYFTDGTITEELVSKSKSIIYGLIF